MLSRMARTVGKIFAAFFVEVLADLGQRFDDGLVFRHFAVEYAQRVGFGAALAIGAHLVLHAGQGLAQSLVIQRTALGTADGVEFERPAFEADGIENGGEHVEDFRIAHRQFAARRRRADDLGVNLEELAVAAFLRALAAEHGADHVELVQQAAAVQVVLDVGANDAGSRFRAKGQTTAASRWLRGRGLPR